MPSKSKAQARLFKAAASNPEVARKIGVSQAQAKEWAKADDRAGTMKKKPERKR